MNLNELALALCEKEGKKQEVNIAQMKEIIHCLRKMISKKPMKILSALLKEEK